MICWPLLYDMGEAYCRPSWPLRLLKIMYMTIKHVFSPLEIADKSSIMIQCPFHRNMFIVVIFTSNVPVYNMLISFLQHVDYLSTTCWLPVYNMLIICLQHVDYLSTTCWLSVYNMLITFLQHVDYLSTTCWLSVYNMLNTCLQHVDYLPATCLIFQYVLEIPLLLYCIT